MRRKKPNFFIAGVARGATTTLWATLKKHPNVFMSSAKELFFFNQSSQQIKQDWESYLKHFEEATDEKIVGEATADYVFSENAPSMIKEMIRDPKIIIQLRNPLERAISHYRLNRREEKEELDFKEAILQEKNRSEEDIDFGFHYVERGLYYEQIKRFYRYFDEDQIKITIFEEFSNNPKKILRDICKFLEIDPKYLPEKIKRYNTGTQLRFPFLKKLQNGNSYLRSFIKRIIPKRIRHKILQEINADLNVSTKKIEVDLIQKEKEKIKSQFIEDIENLEELINKDLSHWK